MGPPFHSLHRTLSAQQDSVMHAGLPRGGGCGSHIGLRLSYRQSACNLKSLGRTATLSQKESGRCDGLD